MNINVDLEKVFEMIRVVLRRTKWYGKITISVQESNVCNMKFEESVNLRKFEVEDSGE